MSKTKYTMVSKSGNEMYSADSFLGFCGMIILQCIFSFIALTVIAMIFCGIGSIFK